MLVKCSIDSAVDDFNIIHSVTLVPRLEYSLNLLSEIIEILHQKQTTLNRSNKEIAACFDEQNLTHLQSLKLEKTYSFCHTALTVVKTKTRGISSINSLPEVLPCSIPIIRTISAQLYEIHPSCSQKLSELSVHLGSIVLDSAILTKARFDFSQSNEESSIILDKVKLIVESKLNKQYPNLDFLKLNNT